MGRRIRFAQASWLAELDKCETQVLLECRLGKRTVARLRKAAERGNALHDRHHKEVMAHAYYARKSQEKSSHGLVFLALFIAGVAFVLWLSS